MAAPADKYIASGNVHASTVGSQKTYSAAGIVSPAATPTDVVVLGNPANSTITLGLRRLVISGVSTAVQNIPVSVTKRSAANTGGTATAPPPVPHVTTDGPAQGVVTAYTVNPTGFGPTVGIMRQQNVGFAAATGVAQAAMIEDFTVRNDKGIVLAPGEFLAINLAGVALTGGAALIYGIEWTEE